MRGLLALALLAAVAGAYLVANTRHSGTFVKETLIPARRGSDLYVDTDAIAGIANPRSVVQDLMNQWNSVPQAEEVFGFVRVGTAYHGSNAGSAFGSFTNDRQEVAFDADGTIMAHYGVGPGVLGLTLKSVATRDGEILDFVCVINTTPGALSGGGTREELFRTTLAHELGHALGLAHSPVGMVNASTFGLAPATASQIATMYPFRTPISPPAGATIEDDDRASLIVGYGTDVGGLGSISGTVRSLGGAPINQIAVRAIGPAGGPESHVGSFSDEDGTGLGRFSIANLAPGDYRVLIETVNGRGSVTGDALATGNNSLGSNPFLFAVDEFWQPGDSYQGDDPAEFMRVRVRAARDTGSVDFVLNGAPIFSGETRNGNLNDGDARVPDGGGHALADYFVFQGSAGQVATITASGSFTPQLRLLRPSDLAQEASDLPFLGSTAQVSVVLDESGVYTILVFSSVGGSYSMTLAGAGSGLAPPPVPMPARVGPGPGDPGDQAFASPVCALPLMQLQLVAPTHEQLFVDRIILRASGTGDDSTDVDVVRIVHDINGNGLADKSDPVLGEGTFVADNGSIVFDNMPLRLEAGSTESLLVVYKVTVRSVSSPVPAGLGWLVALLFVLLLRPRRSLLLFALALMPLSCGGGGGGGCNNSPFDSNGVAVTFRPRIEAGDILAFTATGGDTPFDLATVTQQSGTLTVSN